MGVSDSIEWCKSHTRSLLSRLKATTRTTLPGAYLGAPTDVTVVWLGKNLE
jgi:hypothetical protein